MAPLPKPRNTDLLKIYSQCVFNMDSLYDIIEVEIGNRNAAVEPLLKEFIRLNKWSDELMKLLGKMFDMGYKLGFNVDWSSLNR